MNGKPEAVSAENADMISVFTAAFCSEKKNEALPVPPAAETEPLLEMLRALHGRAKYLTDGKLHVYPVKYQPVFEGIRLERLTGEQFLFLAGVCVSLSVSMGTDCVIDPPSAAALNGARRCIDRVACIRETPAGGLCCGMAAHLPVVHIDPAVPPLFAAGLMAGAPLAWGDTDFVFDRCAPAATHLFCLEQIRAYGGETQTLIDGVRIYSRRDALPPLPEKLRKKRQLFMPRGRL